MIILFSCLEIEKLSLRFSFQALGSLNFYTGDAEYAKTSDDNIDPGYMRADGSSFN